MTDEQNSPWAATILTLFPEAFPGVLDVSLIGAARKAGLWSLEVRDIREHGLGRHRTVDDTPSGGGPGMVLRADVATAALDAVEMDERPRIYLSPRGVPFSQEMARRWASGSGVVMLCGRFEGLDQRAIEARGLEEVSLGDFVLAGGEVAAQALIEASVRLIPGVLGAADSVSEESFSTGLLEYPQYTRPQIFEGRGIPDVLTSGNHKEIAKWRLTEAERLTKAHRPDLWSLYEKARH